MRKINYTFALILMLMLSSCYSVRFGMSDGSAVNKPIPNTDDESYYINKEYYVIDTTVNLGITDADFMINDCSKCENGIYSVEYKVSFDYILLNLITFGSCRKVDIKYVCKKEDL